MNRIRLARGYFIEIDNLNHTLKKTMIAQEGKNKGQEYDKTIGYYGNLERAIIAFLKAYCIEYGDTEVGGLNEYVQMVERINTLAVKQIAAMVEGKEEAPNG